MEEDEHFGVVEEDLEIQEDGLYSQFNAAGGTSVVKTSQPSSVSHHSASRRCCAALWLFLTQFVVATAPRLFAISRRRHWLDLVVNGIPRGAGQVCFMNNPLTGVIIVAGLSVNATTQYTLLGLTGLISSTVLAKLLDVKWGSIRNGLFGYNGILVGYAVPTFMFDVNDPHASTASLWTAFVAVVVFSLFAVVLTVSLGNAMVNVTRTPPFTLPFNISAMLFFLCSGATRNFVLGTRAPSLPVRLDGTVSGTHYLMAWDDQGYFDDGGEVVKAIFSGVSQVFLSGDYKVWKQFRVCVP